MSQEKWFNKKQNTYVEYKGRKNKLDNNNKKFVDFCKMSQKQLKNFLIMWLSEYGYGSDIIIGNGYIYAKGNIPICLTAHMDTVHKELVKDTYEYKDKNGHYLISSPQGIGGDDRCGCYMIAQIIKKGYKPYVVFCEDEEIGCIGSGKFCETDHIKELGEKCNYIIELDRANGNDSVYYDCANDEFEEFINKATGYKTAWGSCSDISNLCPHSEIAGVNLSCGYYNAHTVGEYVDMTEMQHTQDIVEVLLNTESVKYEYKEKVYANYYANYYRGFGYYGYDWGKYDRENNKDNEDALDKYLANKKKDKDNDDKMILEVIYYNVETGEEEEWYGSGEDRNALWVQFFMECPDVSYNMVEDWYEF